MKVRFQADNDLDYRIVRATRQKDRSIDFQSALEAELHGKKDTAVLKIAANNTRVLVSHDRKTMPQNFAEFIQTDVLYSSPSSKPVLWISAGRDEIPKNRLISGMSKP